MSEHLKPSQSSEKLQPIDTSEQLKKLSEQLKHSIETTKGTEHIDSIRDAVEAAAVSVEASSHASEHTTSDSKTHHSWLSEELRAHGYTETLRKVRRHLTRSEKSLSKIVHQPVIEKASELGSKTVARPSGILIGAILSFTGSLIAYILTKQYGYALPNSIFTILFIGGFVVGIVGEFAYKAIIGLRR